MKMTLLVIETLIKALSSNLVCICSLSNLMGLWNGKHAAAY